jgi:transcription elongation factor GreA
VNARLVNSCFHPVRADAGGVLLKSGLPEPLCRWRALTQHLTDPILGRRPWRRPPYSEQRTKEPTVTQPLEQSQQVWLTADAFDKLKSELAELSGPVRAELSRRIGEARDEGDLRENGGYQAAKEEQGKVEARIRQLESMLERAKVGAAPDDGLVEPGMKITVSFAGDDETMTFLLGSREMLAVDASVDIDVYSPQSPLGNAIMGKRSGDDATYTAPNGKQLTVHIVDAVPFK